MLLIILLPFLGFLGGSLFSRFFGYGVSLITTSFVFLSFIYSLYFLNLNINIGDVYIIKLFPWIYVESLEVYWSFCFDSLTSIMLVVVTFISTLVHLYSTEYMKTDPHLFRFMSYLSLFTFFMLILVTSNNLLQLFVGWEGVGVSSYLLINFWFTRLQANKAAIKAMLINRIGDFFLLLAMLSIIFCFNSLDYDVILNLGFLSKDYNLIIGEFQISFLDIVCILLFLGAMGKSAQLGLHSWLPDAMEGPTPVSALIHAATMVTAGVFLLARCSYFFEFSDLSLMIICLIGATTSFFASTTGLFQNDMKRVIAYSTCSQLGYMVFSCGISNYDVGMFHLYNHAFFKALLFLGAGSVIHSLSDEQDLRKMGGLKNILPFSYAAILIGSLALGGFPFLAGFYSKDIILEASYSTYTSIGQFSFFLGLLAVFFTAFYSMRVLFLVFLSNINGNKNSIYTAHEGNFGIFIPLFFLSVISIFIGYLSHDLIIGFGTDFWGTSIFILPKHYTLSDIEFINIIIKFLPLFLSIFGFLTSYLLYRYGLFNFLFIKRIPFFKSLYFFFNKKWYFDRIYNQYISQNILNSSFFIAYNYIDRGLLEVVGPFGITNIIIKYFVFIVKIQKDVLSSYLTYIFLLLIFFVFIFLIQVL